MIEKRNIGISLRNRIHFSRPKVLNLHNDIIIVLIDVSYGARVSSKTKRDTVNTNPMMASIGILTNFGGDGVDGREEQMAAFKTRS